MKKVVVSLLAVASVILTSGCSNVSKDEYNSLVEENSNLKSKISQQEDDLNKQKDSKAEIYDCFDIYAKMLSLPKAAISEEHSNKHSSGLYEEDVFYNENGDLSAKVIMTFDYRLSAEEIAPFIKTHVDGINGTVGQLLQSSTISAQVCIYRYDNGNVIMSQCWYKSDDGTIKAHMFFTSYGEDVSKKISQLYKEEENSVQ